MIYVYNPSPQRLRILVNQVRVQGIAVASPPPSYAPHAIAVAYGPTGVPPSGFSEDTPHFVPGPNQLFTNYTSRDPDHQELGLNALFTFNLDRPVKETLLFFCFRNSLWIMNKDGDSLQTVQAS